MLMHLILQAKQFLSVMGVKEEEGQGLVEYALIIVLIAVVVIAALTAVGGQLETVFESITSGLTNPGAN